jgi:hypothetical protein
MLCVETYRFIHRSPSIQGAAMGWEYRRCGAQGTALDLRDSKLAAAFNAGGMSVPYLQLDQDQTAGLIKAARGLHHLSNPHFYHEMTEIGRPYQVPLADSYLVLSPLPQGSYPAGTHYCLLDGVMQFMMSPLETAGFFARVSGPELTAPDWTPATVLA